MKRTLLAIGAALALVGCRSTTPTTVVTNEAGVLIELGDDVQWDVRMRPLIDQADIDLAKARCTGWGGTFEYVLEGPAWCVDVVHP